MHLKTRKDYRERRHRRVRRKISGTAERPRMAIMKSNRSIYVQFIDDTQGLTLASVALKHGEESKNVAGANRLGQRAAQAAIEKGVRRVVVDRGGFKYHGRIRAVVEGAIAAGLSAGEQRVRAAQAEQKARGASSNQAEEKEEK